MKDNDNSDKIYFKGCLFFIGLFAVCVLFIFSAMFIYIKYQYYSQVLMPKEDFIKEGERFYYENKEGFNNILSSLQNFKYPFIDDSEIIIGLTSHGISIDGSPSSYSKIPKSNIDSTDYVLNKYRDLCKYSFYDKSGNFISISFDKHVNIKRENYRIAYIVDQEDFNFHKNYKFYPHDSIPKEETHFAYQIEGNWYFVSP